MTHDELLAKLADNYAMADYAELRDEDGFLDTHKALRAVVELHYPVIHALPDETCWACQDLYPCPTIQVIEKELS
jgi:hypothetical protein